MRNTVLPLLLCLSFAGCRLDNRNLPTEYSAYQPVLADRGTLDSISFRQPQPIKYAGKIYSIGSYVLINEIDEGYHIIDNSNPKNPQKVGFLAVIASHDAVIRNDVLYSDNASDLVSINISDITKPTLVGRVRNVFPEPLPPDNLPVAPGNAVNNKPANTVIVKWRKSI